MTTERLAGHLSGEIHEAAASGDALSLARVLVSIPSVNPVLEPGGGGEEAVARCTAGWLEGWGYEVRLDEVAPGRYNVLAWRGGTGPSLLLNGHLDTVGVQGMTVDPFAAEVRDGRLLGRGSCDMKGGIAALLSAAAAASRSDPPGQLTVALTADEEHASLGMQRVVDAGVQARAAIVCEPTSLAVMPAHKGFLWVEAEFRGRAAHGSRPELGIDAIRHAALWLVALEEHAGVLAARSPHPLLGRPTFHAGTISGGSAASVYPERCDLVIERRTLPGEGPEEALTPFRTTLESLRNSLPHFDVRVRPGLFRPGTEVPGDHPLVRGLLGAASEEGVDGRVEGMSAWVDAALLNEAGIPAVCFGPGSIAQAHSADEWAPVDEIRVCARVLERFTRRFLGGDC